MQRKTKSGHGGPRPGSGRKPIPEAERRSERLMVNLTPKERRKVERAARAKALSVSDYLRDLVLSDVARRRK